MLYHVISFFYTCYTGKSIDNHISHPHFVGGLARLNHPVGSANSGPSGAHFISGFWIKKYGLVSYALLCFTDISSFRAVSVSKWLDMT
jgi:hypothetical protein